MSGSAVVVGGGYSGTLQAIQLLRHGLARVHLVERGAAARGLAYSTVVDDHLLNVPAARMSAFADAPDHFARFFEAQGGRADGFAPRRVYGDYLQGLLQEAEPGLEIVRGEAVGAAIGDGVRVRLGDGRIVEGDRLILAPGNPRPAPLRGLEGIAFGDPWSPALADGLGPDDTVLLIGTGLTAVDAALTLDSGGFGGRILALSRRGLLPRAHGTVTPAPPAAPDGKSLSARLAAVRRDADALDWRAAVDRLRPITQALWQQASGEERRRFLRHLRPWWDVHRHRIAPQVADRLERMRGEGRLHVAAGRIVSAQVQVGGARITWRARGADEVQSLDAARVVNCTGPEFDIARAGDPLLTDLLRQGLIRPDPLRIGIDVDTSCRTLSDAGASERLFAVGPPTRGAVWEIVAVPDIRVQVAQLAARLAA